MSGTASPVARSVVSPVASSVVGDVAGGGGTVTVDVQNPEPFQTITFTSTAAGQWYRNGNTIDGETSEQLAYEVTGDDHNASFRCGASNSLAITLDIAPVLTEWDYFISPSGNNANAGTSFGAAWEDFTPLATLVSNQSGGAGGVTWKVRIASGTYDGGFNPQQASDPASPVVVYLDFETGCTLRKGATAAEGGIGAFNTTMVYVLGRGLILSGYNTASDGNALGAYNSGQLKAWNCVVTSAVDCVSAHATSRLKVIDSQFSGGTKSAFAHIDSATGYGLRCTFTGSSGAALGIGRHDDSTVFKYHACSFVPAASNQLCGLDRCTLTKCKVGTLSHYVDDTPNASTATRAWHYDGFVRLAGQLRGSGGGLVRCYGGYEGRLCSGDSTGTPYVIRNSILKGSSKVGAYVGVIVNTASNGAESFQFIDTVFTTWNNVIHYVGTDYSAGVKTYINANSLISYCGFYDNTTNLPAWITCDTNSVESVSDPGLGDMDTTDQVDWALPVDSDYIGVGSSGGNIGFALSDIPA